MAHPTKSGQKARVNYINETLIVKSFLGETGSEFTTKKEARKNNPSGVIGFKSDSKNSFQTEIVVLIKDCKKK